MSLTRAEETLSSFIDLITRPDAYDYVLAHDEQVKHYFEDESLINMSDQWGFTPLHYAASDSSPEMAKLLLAKGAEVDILNNAHVTPLIVAIKRFKYDSFEGALKWVQLFIESRADVTLRCAGGKAAIEYLIEIFMKKVKSKSASVAEAWASKINFEPLIALVLMTPRAILDFAESGDNIDSLLYKFCDFVFSMHQYQLFEFSPTLGKVISSLVQAINPVSTIEIDKIVSEGHLIPVKRYMQDNPDSRCDLDHDGDDILMRAVIYGHLSIVHYLLTQNWSLRVFNYQGESVLMLAVKHKQDAIFNYLLKNATQEDLCAFQTKASTLLSTAVDSGEKEIEKYLIAALTRKKQLSNFLYLIENASLESIKNYAEDQFSMHLNEHEIRKNGSFISAGYRLKNLQAIQSGTQLQESLCFIHERSADGKTALHHLVTSNYYRTIRDQFPGRLFERHVGYILEMNMVNLNRYFCLMEVLITFGVDLHQCDYQDNTALMISAKTPNYMITDDLLKRGLAVNAVNIHGETALMMAARAGYDETVRVLINGGADSHIQNKEGKTALDLAKNKAVRQLLQPLKPKMYHERYDDGFSSAKRLKLG